MKTETLCRLLAAAASFSIAHVAHAQMPAVPATLPSDSPAAMHGESPRRMQMMMDREEFLRTHEWSENAGHWRLKEDVDLPSGVKSRADVKADRDQFLRNNRWSDADGGWVPIKEARNLSTMSRAEVRADTARFLKTHRWDEATSTWTDRAPRKANR
jgi:hypothetical protein